MGRLEMDPNDFDKNISKPNRRRIVDDKDKGQMIVGGKPPTAIHRIKRKDRDRQLGLAMEKALKTDWRKPIEVPTLIKRKA